MSARIHSMPGKGGSELAWYNEALKSTITRWTEGKNGLSADIPGVHFHRWEHPTQPAAYTMEASICLIAQGSKRVMLGEDAYDYDAEHYLVTSVDLPIVAQILEASAERPYLGVIIGLDQQEIAQLIVDANLPEQGQRRTDRGIGVSPLTLPILKALTRLVELQDNPEDIPMLAPLIKKELYYRLLMGPQGPRLRQLVINGAHGHQIAKSIDWLKSHFKQSDSVDDLADRASMSRSAFYHHFKSMTSLSPLQYLNHLRLQEPRRLMVVGQYDATTAALEVGYESPSQFNREYRRLFGLSPAKDAASLRATAHVTDESAVLTG